MSSNMFATSFYMSELQPTSWIEQGEDFPHFELISVKSPLILTNDVEPWMKVPFFQEMLTDVYFKRYSAIYEEQKQILAAEEFR